MSKNHKKRLDQRVIGSLLRGRRPRIKTAGHSPGVLVFEGEKKLEDISFRVIQYDRDKLEESAPESIGDCLQFKDTEQVTWLHVAGLHEVDKIGELAEAFDIHPLVTEDVLNTRQRPKIDEFDGYVFIVANLLHITEGKLDAQHFCLLMLKNAVVTFSEEPTEAFAPVIRRIREGRKRIRSGGTDYLTWAIIDAVVDHYFGVIDALEDSLIAIDVIMQDDFKNANLGELYGLRREVAFHRISETSLTS